jgi:intracellular septation protein
MWKPTALYWAFAAALLGSQLLFGRNLVHKLIGEELQDLNMPAHAWSVLNWSWAIFFIFMGVLNLYVAFNYSFTAWTSFKAFGATGLMFVFIVAQTVYLSRYTSDSPKESGDKAPGRDSQGPG